jgi:hypothetical protein
MDGQRRWLERLAAHDVVSIDDTYKGVGTHGEDPRDPGPNVPMLAHERTTLQADHPHAISRCTNRFSEQILDRIAYSRPTDPPCPRMLHRRSSIHMLNLHRSERRGDPAAEDATYLEEVNGKDVAVAGTHGRVIYERANNIFRRNNAHEHDYLVEYVCPIPNIAWKCSVQGYAKYMEFAASIFFSRLRHATTRGADAAIVINPPVNWRRDIVREYQGAHQATSAAIGWTNIGVRKAHTLMGDLYRRTAKVVIVHSAVMAAETSLLNASREASGPAFGRICDNLEEVALSVGEGEALVRWLAKSAAVESKLIDHRMASSNLNRIGNGGQPPKRPRAQYNDPEIINVD